MENPRKLSGQQTSTNDRKQLKHMRNLKKEDGSNNLICDSDLSHVINRNVNQTGSFRQRNSMSYARDWLNTIKSKPNNMKYGINGQWSENSPKKQTCLIEIKPLQENLMKASPRTKYNSAKNYTKYREKLRESQKIRNRIHNSFMQYWNQIQKPLKTAEESRDLVPLRKPEISEIREKENKEVILPDEERLKIERRQERDELRHPLLHSFLDGEKGDTQRVITVNGINGEALVIYRRNSHSRINDWKNYQFQQIAIGKTKLDLRFGNNPRRSSSETRVTSSLKQMCITRRRRTKFHCEPVRLGTDVSIEFKKFDEIREMFHPNESNSIIGYNAYENSFPKISDEFRFRKSAERKLNLFKELKRSERHRRKKFRQRIANSSNHCRAITETFPTRIINRDEKVAAAKEEKEEVKKKKDGRKSARTVESLHNLSPLKEEELVTVKEYNETESTVSLSDTENSLMSNASTENRETADELSDSVDQINMKENLKDVKIGKIADGSEARNNYLMNFLEKDPPECSELQELILKFKNTLKNCSDILKPEEKKFLNEMRISELVIPRDEFPEERILPNVSPIIAYPVSVAKSHRKGSDSYRTTDDYQLKRVSGSKNGRFHREARDKMRKNEDQQRWLLNSARDVEPLVFTSYMDLQQQNLESDDLYSSIGNSKVFENDPIEGKQKNRKWKRKSMKSEKPVQSSEESSSVDRRELTPEKVHYRRQVERKIMKLDQKLKCMLRRIKVYPLKDQVAIKKCLEKLKETSEAVLRRLRTDQLCSSLRYYSSVEDASDHTRKDHSKDEKDGSAVRVNSEKQPIIVKTSESEIQLNVGMEITMENFDPATGKKIRPEQNRDFQQEGNIQCKLLKSGETPVTFIDTDFLYNPKTGMLFQKNEKSNRRSISIDSRQSPNPTNTFLISKTIKHNYPESGSPRIKFVSGKNTKNLRMTTYREPNSSPETSKSMIGDAYRLAIDREEMKNLRLLREGRNTSRSYPGETSSYTKKEHQNRRVSVMPILSSSQNQGRGEDSSAAIYKKKKTRQVHQLESQENEDNESRVVMISDKGAQTNITNVEPMKILPKLVEKKSMGVQIDLKTSGKILVNRSADTTFLGTPLWALRRGMNVSVQTNSSEILNVLGRGPDASSQTDLLLAEAQKYLKELETQKRLAKLFSYTWTFGFFICKLVYYMQSVSAICSVLTLTAMSVERYYAIVHPMRAQYVCTISQARRIITFTWISAFFLAIPVLFAQIHMPVGVRVKGFWCVRDYDSPTIWRAHETYMLLLILIIPTGVMGVAYTTICFEIWQVMQRRQDLTSAKILNIRYNKAPMNSDSFKSFGKEKKQQRSNYGESPDDEAHVKQVIKMLVAVVVIYVVCWAPLLIDNILQAYGVLPFMKFGKQKYMATAFHLMAYFNSCINPIVYGFMSKNFRESFHKTLCCTTRKGRTSIRNTSMSHDRNTSIRYAESSFGRTVSITMPD